MIIPQRYQPPRGSSPGPVSHQQEHISNRDLVRGIDEQKQALEEEQRKLFIATKQKMVDLKKAKEVELFR